MKIIVNEYLLLLVGLEEKHHGQYIDENFLDSGWSCAAHASFASPAQEWRERADERIQGKQIPRGSLIKRNFRNLVCAHKWHKGAIVAVYCT